MNFPLSEFIAVSTANPWTYVVFGVIGFAFGYTLEMSGFGDSRKLAAQFYFTELTVLKVMFTAILTAMVLLFGAVGLGLLNFNQVWVNPTYLWSGLLGGLIMGAGFIVGGFCPTTSLASASTGKIDGMFFMLGGFFGAAIFAETEPLFTNWFNNAGYYGRVTLDQVFHLPLGVVVMLVILMALVMFWGAEQLERIFGKRDLAQEPKARIVGMVFLMIMGMSVMLMGDPTVEERYSRARFTRMENEVQVRYTADEILARRLIYITPAEAFSAKYNPAMNPVYIDVRSEADYNLYHLADAIHIPLDRLTDAVSVLLAEPPTNTVFIVMSNDEAAAVVAWKLFTGSNLNNVYILEGGINNWIAFFGGSEEGFTRNPLAGEDQLAYLFTQALGDRYESCSPDPIAHKDLEFESRIILQLRRDKSGGGCG